ncbi:hypothetical protein PQ478_07655 [Alkalihalophilus pseudofirmus]|nr:hypothetical protein [Alkalihalophilus pseudofirmus]WEG18348.1 hypothetical protein PQ478_07655 [Alkalihalophilus pseudofirmus]
MKKSTTKSGTNIDEVKELNAKSGLTYNEVKDKVLKAYINKQLNEDQS